MRTIRNITILLCISAVTAGAGKPEKHTAGKRMRMLESSLKQRDANQPDSNDISEYYGFGEMEIIKLDYGIQSLLIADFDGDGRNDIAVANNTKAGIEILLQKDKPGSEEQEVAVDPNDEDINALVGLSRFRRQTVPVSQRIYSLVAGDLNADGLVDLAFYGEPRGLYVMLQKPDKEKEQKNPAWQTKKRIAIDDALPSENALVCADMNNDGKKDLILASLNTVYIVLQKQDGTLAEPVKYASAARILGVDAGDLNGDDKCDLIAVTDDADRPIHVRLGQQTNQLGPQMRLFIERPLALELSDIDGKKGAEVVTIDAVSRRLVCYEFIADESQDEDWPVLFYPLTAGKDSDKRDLVIGDIDGDGLSDVVLSEPGAAELVWYKQIAGVGLAEPERFPALAGTDTLSITDIDDDGRNEIGVLSVQEKVIGISRFEEGRLSFPQAIDIPGEPLAMELTDVDADGAIDCIYIARSQKDTRSFGVIYDVAQANRTDVNSVMEVELKRLVANPQGIKAVDVDQDGLKDVLVFIRYELPILIRQTEKRTFEVVDSPGAQTSLIKEAMVRSTAVSDIDGRAGDELLVAQNNFARSMVLSDGSWTVIDQYNAKSAENRISAVAVVHLKGSPTETPAILLLDGYKGRLQILSAGDDKTYRFDKELDVGTWNAAAGIKMMLASLTGATETDIVLFDSEKFAIVVPPGAGTLQPGLEQKLSYETKIKDGSYGNFTTGDINGDGLVDIIMVEYKHNHIEILALDSTCRAIPAMRFKIFEDKSYREMRPRQTAVEPRQLKVADVTGDGKADLVTVIHDRIIVYPQD